MRSALTVPAAVLSALLAGPPAPARGERPPAAAAQSGIRVTFKLDPRLSGPTYGGERWVSPQTYSGANAQDAVEARVFAVDDKGRSTRTSAVWSPSDPELVTVSPARGEQVKIVAKRAGESSVTVTAGGTSKKLMVKAVQANGIWHVNISQ